MVTKAQAIRETRFEHVRLKNADGTALRAHANGRCKVCKTRPAEFKLPCKHGMYDYFYITQDNAADWNVA